jgi:hypothetical protein
MIDKIINMAVSLFLSVLSGDLLYLYFAGGWYDPSKLIEYSEVVLLFILAVVGIIRFIIITQQLSKLKP